MSRKRGAPVAPYLPFKTFLTALDHLSRGTSNPIDRTALNLSGTNVPLVLDALAFFGLIDHQGMRQSSLEALLDPAQRQAKLKDLLESCYPVVVRDLKGMTQKRLIEVLGLYRVTGETAEKARAFFLRAAQYAGLPLPQQLLQRKLSTRRTRQKTPKPQPRLGAPANQGGVEETQNSNHGTKTIELKSGRRITLTIEADWFEVAPDEIEFVVQLIAASRAPVVRPIPVRRQNPRYDVSAQLGFAAPDSGSWRGTVETKGELSIAPAEQDTQSKTIQSKDALTQLVAPDSLQDDKDS